MQLAELVQRMPGGRLATKEDNARILAFFDRTPMHTSAFALQYRRSPDFFRLLRYQGDRAHVVLSVDERGDVRGLGTISLRRAWLDGEAATVGYLGDLRIGFHRGTIGHWRQLVRDVVARSAEIEELADCACWLTTIMDDNHLARRVLASGRAGAPALVPIAPFTMRNVVARLPFARRERDTPRWRVRRAGPEDRERLGAFHESANRGTPFGFRDELARRLADWDGLALSDFLIASAGETIVGCAAPWSASGAKQMLVSSMPMAMRLLERVSAVLPRGMVRVPRAGEPLRVAYLTHLTFAADLGDADRLGVFRALLDDVFDRWRSADWHCLAVADFAGWNLARALHGYIQQSVPITIYAAVPPGADAERVRASWVGAPPAFEMATV